MFGWLERQARPRVLAALGALIVALVALLVTPASPVEAIKAVSHGTGILDEMPWASANQVTAVLEAYGTEGRRLYLSTVLVIDTATPVVINLFVSLALVALLRRRGWYGHRTRWLAAAPALGWALDMAENGTIAWLLMAFEPPVGALGVVGVLTGLKFVVNGSTALAVLALGVANLTSGRRSTAGRPPSSGPLP